MKKTSLLALALAPMILGTPLALQAQDESVTTDPVGFVKTTLTSGTYSLVGINLTHASVYASKVASAATDSITVVDNAAELETHFEAGNKYFVEITGGALVGDRIDVASASGNVISLDLAAPGNTLTDGSAIPADSTFVIRKHYTIGDLSGDVTGESLLGGTGPTNSDQILTFENGNFKAHFLGSDGNWYDASTFDVVNDKPIAPGSGVLFFANPEGGARDLELLVLGEVRTNDVVLPLEAGFQIVSTGFPMELSPADLMMTTEFFTGGTGPANADQILTFENGNFKSHFLGTDNNWYSASDFSLVTDADIFTGQGSVLVFRNAPDGDFRIANQL